MHAYIVAGSSKEKRDLFIQSLLKDWKIAKCDQIWLRKLDNNDSLGISLVKEWQKQCQLSPVASSKLAGIINEADFLTVEAQNALLKLLEDPPSSSMFILGASQISVLLPTIVSRCQITASTSNQPTSASFIDIQKQLAVLTDQTRSYGHKINYADSIIQNKYEAQKWVETAIQYCEYALRQHQFRWAPVIRSLLFVRQLLEANVSYKLAIDRIILP